MGILLFIAVVVLILTILVFSHETLKKNDKFYLSLALWGSGLATMVKVAQLLNI
jgi:hypothetical protein